MERDPCPWRTVDDTGGGFAIGLVGGSIWHFVGGFRNAPKGHGISQAIARVQVRVPVTAGAFAVWGTIFSCFDCALTGIRKKEDPWNAIMSGALTGGFLASRAGMKAMGKNAAIGGVILAAMEGVGIAFQRVLMPYIERKMNPAANTDLLTPPVDPSRKRAYGSLYNQPLSIQANTRGDSTGQENYISSNDRKFADEQWKDPNANTNEKKKSFWGLF